MKTIKGLKRVRESMSVATLTARDAMQLYMPLSAIGDEQLNDLEYLPEHIPAMENNGQAIATVTASKQSFRRRVKLGLGPDTSRDLLPCLDDSLIDRKLP